MKSQILTTAPSSQKFNNALELPPEREAVLNVAMPWNQNPYFNNLIYPFFTIKTHREGGGGVSFITNPPRGGGGKKKKKKKKGGGGENI